MIKEKTFQLQLKNDQSIELKFTSIPQTNNQLWQMFATTEALEIVQQMCESADPNTTKSARKTAPKKKDK